MPHADVWDRARRGLHSVLLSRTLPPPPQELRVVRVSCDVPSSTLGPLLDARDRIEGILGLRAPLVELARSGVMSLRRHLVGDVASATSERSFVDVCNRLAALGPAALVLDGVDAADGATLAMLHHLVARGGALRLPLVLTMTASPSTEAASALVAAVREACGEDSVVEVPAAPQVAVRPFDPHTLPPVALRVLRALSVAGSGCEARTLAAVLGTDELDVLDALQVAADVGVVIDDRGEGRIHVADGVLAAIRATILPSFAAAMHRRLADELAAPPTSPALFELDGAPPPRPGDAWEVLEAPPAQPAVEPPSPAPLPSVDPPNDDLSDASGSPADVPLPLVDAACAQPPSGEVSVGARSAAREPRATQPRDDARSARHLEAAGDAELAILRFVDAMRTAASSAAYPKAVAHAEAALALLDRLPQSDARRLQRADISFEVARVLWHGAGPGEAFTLPSALRVADAARALLRTGDPPDLVADMACGVAGILYEIGDVDALARAERELGDTSRALAARGQPLAATRLFNDQANVLLRVGDPVRAAHLLMESRKVFEPRAKTDAIAMAEMAETDHLFARVLLAVPARPGREADALSLALDHAIAAERGFRRLAAPREAARARETMGRIELRRGRVERAVSHLDEAVEVQRAIGDVIGLARSSAAMSEVLTRAGRLGDALGLLADSIALNAEKRSPVGLAFNRRALAELAERTAEADPNTLAAVEAQLVAAERLVAKSFGAALRTSGE